MPGPTVAEPTLDLFSELIDRTSPVPLYFQISRQLEDAIRSGRLAPGTKLDNELELCRRLAVSRPTVRRALERLARRGILVRRRGLGTVVVARPVSRPVALSSLYDDLVASHRQPTTRVLTLRIQPAGDQADPLSLSATDPVQFLERLRFADHVPLALMRNYLPAGLAELTTELLEQHGLYHVLRAQGVQLQAALQTIGARVASRRERQLLEAPAGTPVLIMTRTTFDTSGRPVEYATHAYRADRYWFELQVAAG
jgi:DNA-binding GntR family transcriptional regulator